MSASAAQTNIAASAVAAVITYWGLVNASGTELTGGSYTRIATAATNASGVVRPVADVPFNVPASTTVGGWRAYSASSGGTNYGGGDISPNEVYGAAGTLTLAAASTGFSYTAV